MAGVRCVSVDFEVKGKVQGVFFRKFTKQEADKLKLNGWVENLDDKNIVKGCIIGNEKSVSAMKLWLKTKGSPKSRIESASFTNEQDVTAFKYVRFDIKK
jgi:acylphosphatase